MYDKDIPGGLAPWLRPQGPALRRNAPIMTKARIDNLAAQGEGPWGWRGESWMLPCISDADVTDVAEANDIYIARQGERHLAFLEKLEMLTPPCTGCPLRAQCASKRTGCLEWHLFIVRGWEDKWSGRPPMRWWWLLSEQDLDERPPAFREAYDDGLRSFMRGRLTSKSWWSSTPGAEVWWRAGLYDANDLKLGTMKEWDQARSVPPISKRARSWK